MEKLEAIEDWFKLQKKYVDPQSKLHALACQRAKLVERKPAALNCGAGSGGQGRVGRERCQVEGYYECVARHYECVARILRGC